jgi:dTDP-4-dehydrorhamnose 3,5-epimerase
VILEPRVFSDARGFFFESYNERTFAALGITARFVQDNHSRSQRDTVRGLHYQLRQPQAKLCRVTHGAVLDACVDLRVGSPTFGEWVTVLLSAENRRQLFVPEGFAHGFRVLTEAAEFLYKCSRFYDPAGERGIAWDDPEIGIAWGLESSPILSNRDARLPRLAAVPGDELPLFSPRSLPSAATGG